MCLVAVLALSSCDTLIQFIFGTGNNNNNNGDDNNNVDTPTHTHEMEYHSLEQPTCNGAGTVEYWYCAGCKKYFGDEKGESEIADIKTSATGHLWVLAADATSHWQQCKYCNEVNGDKQEHSSSQWLKNKTDHYKTCDVCGIDFGKDDHAFVNDVCNICGYFTNYQDRCNSSYGYEYFANYKNGAKLQSFYKDIDDKVTSIHNNANFNAGYDSSRKAYKLGELNYAKYGLSPEEAQSVWSTYRNDNPLYYWITGNILFTSTSINLCVDSKYALGSDRTKQNAKLYSQIGEYVEAVANETSAYQVTLALHDMIIDNIDYARNEQGQPSSENWAHSILGVFDKKSAVCEGYAKAFQLLLNVYNIGNVFVTGSSKGEGHAWNMACLDNEWYWYDLTWDDQPTHSKGVIYDYFCKSDNNFNDHTIAQANDWGMNYLYGLPNASQKDYDSDNIELGETFIKDGFTFSLCRYDKVTVEKYSGINCNVEIPNVVTYGERDYTVVEIGASAFKSTKIVSLVIPQNVAVINNLAFNGCNLLTKVTFADTTGWTRSSLNGSFVVDSEALKNTSKAASLLKEYYKKNPLDASIYQYVWQKSAQEAEEQE